MEKYKIILLIIILGTVVYANTFKNSFVWDDKFLITNNEYIKDWSHIQEIFKINLFHSAIREGNFYRPIQSLSLMFDYSLWRLNPFGYHLTNLLLHILNAILIYFLIEIISRNKKISLITSLLFLVHPIHTEAVTYISGRALLAFYLYIRSITLKRSTPYLGSLLFFLLALLSKEIALIFPLILFLYDCCFSKPSRPKYRHLPFLIILGVYLFVRFFLLDSLIRLSITGKGSLYLRLLTMPKVIISYLRLLFLPLNLHMERRIPLVTSFFEPPVLISLILLILIGILTLKMFKHSRIILFSIAWFFLNLVPVSNIVPLNARMAEHWLYLPSLGFFLFLAIGIADILEKKKFIIIFFILILAFYSTLTIRRNRDWKDELTFYQNTLKYSPWSAKVHNNLGLIYLKEGEYDKAREEFKKLIELKPNSAKGHYSLGRVYAKREEYDKAIDKYKRALKFNPDYSVKVRCHHKIGLIYKKRGELDKAVIEWERILELFQDYEGIKLDKSEIGKVIELLKENEEK
jgi:hypothetical protein